MKVLHITNNYPTKKNPVFGIFVKEQIESLSKLGINNDVFFINGREEGKLGYIKSIFRLRKFLRKKQYNIIHCHHALSALCLIFSGQARKFKTVVSYQNDPINEQGKYLCRFIQNNCNAIILKNNSSLVDGKAAFYQPNGINTDFFTPITRERCLERLNLSEDKQYILFVSSNFIREQKRYDRFQKVIEILKSKYNLNKIEELKLINIKRSLVPLYFNVASLHLLSSEFEGSPNSVKESMACNLPVVSTNVGNVQELLANVNGSFISNTKDAEELAGLAFKALNYSGTINSRAVLINKKLDHESVANNIFSIYKNITNEKK